MEMSSKLTSWFKPVEDHTEVQPAADEAADQLSLDENVASTSSSRPADDTEKDSVSPLIYVGAQSQVGNKKNKKRL